MSRAHHYFVYTNGGVDAAVRAGMDVNSITVVNNATDTKALLAACASVTHEQADKKREELGLTGAAALYVGALDESKRLDLLLQAVQMVRRRVPNFKLVIAGDGPQRGWLESMVRGEDAFVIVGRASDSDKAVLSAICTFIAMPGRVGSRSR